MGIDAAIVHARLRSMSALLSDVGQIGPVDARRLDSDRIIRHAVERIVTQLVDLAVSINSHVVAATRNEAPAIYRASFTAMGELGVIDSGLAAKLATSAGLRNILTHEYVAVDLDILAGALPEIAELFKRYIEEVARYLAGPRS